MIIKPVYLLTDEEFEKVLPETLTAEEENEYLCKVYEQELPIYLEEFARLIRKYGFIPFEDVGVAELTSYGGKGWARLIFFLKGLMPLDDYREE